MKLIIIGIVLIGLFFTFTNFIPLSAISVLVILFLPFLSIKRYRFNYIFISLFFLLLYFFISGIIYSPSAFFEYDFYRRDGNVFVTFTFLLTLLLFKYPLNINKIFDCFLYLITFINLILLCVSFNIGEYYRLFEAHNAAGGFMMIISAISIGKLLTKFSVINLSICIINFCNLFHTASRGSILGLVCACIMLLCYLKGYEKVSIRLFLLFQIVLYSWLYLNAPSDFLETEFNHFDEELFDSTVFDRAYTFIVRGFYLWPRAIYLFLKSPIFGTGFGSYNDVPYNLKGIDNFFMHNQGIFIFDDHHAHNTFLHVLGENGIVGLILLLVFIYFCNQYIKKISEKYISYSLYLCLWSSIFSSITEHRFFTPSQMFPFVILFGLSHIALNYNNKKYIFREVI